MNEHSILTPPKRKAQVTTLLLQFLQSINMKQTVDILRQQSQHQSSKSVNEQIKIIQQNQKLTKFEQNDAIKKFLQKQFKRLLRNNQNQQAVQLLRGPMSHYIEDVDRYSTYFLQIPQKEQPYLNKFFTTYFSQKEQIKLPRYKVLSGNFQQQIWYLKCNGKETIAIDKAANAIIFKGKQIVAQRDKLHSKYVTSVKWGDEETLGTTGADTKVKIWNKKLQCLRVIANHEQYVTCIAFSPGYIYSGGNENYILVTARQENGSSIKIPSQSVIDMHYLYSKSRMISVVESKKRSYIHFYQNRKRIQGQLIAEKDKIYYIEISQCENFLYANCKNSEVHIWNINTKTLFRRFSGYTQENCMMRMSIGGPNGQFLVISSQNSEVIFFHTSRSEPVGKIQIQPKSAVNCVCWVNNNDIILGSDNGRIEQWSNLRSQEQIFQKLSVANLATEMYKNLIPDLLFLNRH